MLTRLGDGCCDPLGCKLCNSKLTIVEAKHNYVSKYSDTCKSSLPIKTIDKTISTPTEAVVNRDSINAVITTMPYLKDGNKEQPKQYWRCLLDSGSDGNLIFMKKRNVCTIPNVKMYVPLGWKPQTTLLKQKSAYLGYVLPSILKI